jgi:hypothetical protein
MVADRSKERAASSAPQQRKAAAALLGKGTSREAQLSIRNTGRLPFGIGAFMGALQFKQFPIWVGNDWDIEVAGGPYVVGEAVRANLDEIVEEFELNIGHAVRSAGLDIDGIGEV